MTLGEFVQQYQTLLSMVGGTLIIGGFLYKIHRDKLQEDLRIEQRLTVLETQSKKQEGFYEAHMSVLIQRAKGRK